MTFILNRNDVKDFLGTSNTSLFSIIASLDDINEGILKRGTADEETINVGLRNQLSSILLCN